MIRRPEIYISAASLDLGIAVNLVRAEILQIGATPVHIEAYPAEWRAAWSLMEHHIGKCDAFVHIAGECLGSEPGDRPPSEPRRSYAQLELAVAKSLGKPVFACVCGEAFPYLSHPVENVESQDLQKAHRQRLIRHHGAQAITPGVEELRQRVRQLKPALEEMWRARGPVGDPSSAHKSPAANHAGSTPVTQIAEIALPGVPPPTKHSRPWHAPPLVRDFVGRSQEKERVVEALKADRRVAVIGTRGIGKTALIGAAIHELAPGPDAPGLFTSGVFRHHFHEGAGHYAAMSTLLTQAGLGDVADTKHEAALKQLLAKPGTCLILEGCESAQSLDRLLALAGDCYVVIEAAEPFRVAGFQEVVVHQLPIEDAAFLLYRARVVAESTELAPPVVRDALVPPYADGVWQALARRLGAHPLILGLTAKRLKSDATPPYELQTSLERNGIDVFESVAAEHGSVPWIFANCSQELLKQDPQILAAWYALSLHAHTWVPLKSLAAALGMAEDEVEFLLKPLVARDFAVEGSIRWEASGTKEKAWKLTSVALAESARLQWEWRDPIQQNPAFDPRAVYSRWRDWCLVYLRECWKTRSVLGGVDRYHVLEPHLHYLLDAIERYEGVSSPNLLAALRWFSSLLRLLGRFASAQPLSERLLTLSHNLYGPEHPETLSSMNNLATLHYRRGDLAASEPLYRHSLQLREKILGRDHPDTLSSLNNMANVLADKKDFRGAESLYRASYEGRQRVLGGDHQDTLVSAKNLANLLLDKGDFNQAEPLYRETLETQIRVLGAIHPDTAMTAYNYARLCLQLRRMPEAVALAQHAADTARKNFPDGHPHRQRYEQLLSRLTPESTGRN